MALGLWILWIPIPKGQVASMVNEGNFMITALSYHYPRENDHHVLTELVVGRWAFLTRVEKTEEDVTEEVVLEELPPIPQPVLPQERQEEEVATEGGDWVLKTMLPTGNHVTVGDIYVANSGKVSVEDTVIPSSSPILLEYGVEEPQILIYHSHGTESYTPTEGFEYEESDPFRTLEEGRNIITVGKAMAEVFEEAGFSVIHDESLHDYPDYNASYGNSQVTLQEYLTKYPSIELIFDVHRDALADSNGTPYQLVSQQGDDLVAQVMIVVGSNGDGYQHDHWRENFDLALTLQQGLLEYGDFARPVTLRSSRFNQHLSTGALLLEIGGHGNTLQQAVDAGILFAQSVVDTLGES